MRFIALLGLFCFTLLACTPEHENGQRKDESSPPAIESPTTDSNIQNSEVDLSATQETSSQQLKETTPVEHKPLDLTWDRKMPAPEIKEQHLLPNFFAEKKAEKKRASVGGKVYRNDDPTMPVMDSVEGAEVSIKVLVP